MDKRSLTDYELENIRPGEPITMALVLASMVIGLLAVVIYRLFMSYEGTVKLPGGYQFTRK